MLLEVSAAWGGELHGDELEALGLEAGNNLANESSLDTIGLDHDKGFFFLPEFFRVKPYFKCFVYDDLLVGRSLLCFR